MKGPHIRTYLDPERRQSSPLFCTGRPSPASREAGLRATFRGETGQSGRPDERLLANLSDQQMALADDTRDAGLDEGIKTGPDGWRELTHSANGV